MISVYFNPIIENNTQPESIIEYLKLAKRARNELPLSERIDFVDQQAALGNPFIDTIELVMVAGEVEVLKYQ